MYFVYFRSPPFFFLGVGGGVEGGDGACFPANLKITVCSSAGSHLAEEKEAQIEKQPD